MHLQNKIGNEGSVRAFHSDKEKRKLLSEQSKSGGETPFDSTNPKSRIADINNFILKKTGKPLKIKNGSSVKTKFY